MNESIFRLYVALLKHQGRILGTYPFFAGLTILTSRDVYKTNAQTGEESSDVAIERHVIGR